VSQGLLFLSYLPLLLKGALSTLEVTLMAEAVVITASAIAGFARLSNRRIVLGLASVYVEIFRGTSGLVQLYFFFFVLPILGLFMNPIPAGVLALGLNFGAYGSEIVRAGILGVDPGQREAGVALNMSSRTIMWRIILPQAIVAMVPQFVNLSVELLKATALVAVVGIHELTYIGKVIAGNTGWILQSYSVALLLYFLLGFPLSRLGRTLERQVSKGLGLVRAER